MILAELRIHGDKQPGILVADDTKRAQLTLQSSRLGEHVSHLNVNAHRILRRDEIHLVVPPSSNFDGKSPGEKMVANHGFELDADILCPVST